MHCSASSQRRTAFPVPPTDIDDAADLNISSPSRACRGVATGISSPCRKGPVCSLAGPFCCNHLPRAERLNASTREPSWSASAQRHGFVRYYHSTPPLDAGRTPLYARRRDLTPEPDPLISARLACVALAGGRKGPVPMPGPFCQITRSGGHISSSRAAAGDGHDSERSGIKRTLP